MSNVLSIFAAAALIAGLVIPTVLPEVANVSAIVLMVVGLGLVLVDPGARQIARHRSFVMIYMAFAIFFLALCFTAKSPMHLAAILVLTPLWLSGPFAALIDKAPPALKNPFILGVLALAGTTGAFLVAVVDVMVLGIRRGGVSVNNPIHLADLTVTLGFFALIGLFSANRWRWIVLLAPILALATVMLSGSRGPLVAFVALTGICILFLIYALRTKRWLSFSLATILVAGIAIAPFVSVNLDNRTFRAVEVLQELAVGSSDNSSNNERLYMLRGAWGAFQASPIFGHGLIDYKDAAVRYGPEDNPYTFPAHLHSDLADFAASGGVMGLTSLFLVLLAPLAVIGTAASGQRPMLIFAAVTLSAGYFVMGLTNAMFGILTQTMLFGFLLALLVVLSRFQRA